MANRETWDPGQRAWFEYHCWESEQSNDAQAWFRSHEQVEVLSHDATDHDCLRSDGLSREGRSDEGQPCLYRVRFEDGLTWHVFEDELFDSRADFSLADPPAYTRALRVLTSSA